MNDEELICRRCGVDITERENFCGAGHCFCCASTHGPKDVRRPFNESAIEMGCAEMVE
jgi:hypothetical protein